MASIEDLKQMIDLHDLADKLGLERPQGRGNYKSPHHDDKSPSLSIYQGGTRWKDHSQDNTGGTCIDLVCYIVEKSGEKMKRKLLIKWWAMLGLNQRPLPCEITYPFQGAMKTTSCGG